MSTRFEHYNEITFQAYCIVAIERAVMRGARQKAQRSKREIPLSALKEEAEVASLEFDGLSAKDMAAEVFDVNGQKVPVLDERLANALRSLPPQKRNIVLLAYLLEMTDAEIGKELNLPRTTVRDRRQDAIKRLQTLMGGHT